VPILVGDLSEDVVTRFAKVLLPYFERKDVFFSVSSDFCHWGLRFGYTPNKAKQDISTSISQLDHEGMDIIETKNALEFRKYLKRTENTICGRNPILLLLEVHDSLFFSLNNL
jgi:AmmeMemoRadiSam system protein B